MQKRIICIFSTSTKVGKHLCMQKRTLCYFEDSRNMVLDCRVKNGHCCVNNIHRYVKQFLTRERVSACNMIFLYFHNRYQNNAQKTVPNSKNISRAAGSDKLNHSCCIGLYVVSDSKVKGQLSWLAGQKLWLCMLSIYCPFDIYWIFSISHPRNPKTVIVTPINGCYIVIPIITSTGPFPSPHGYVFVSTLLHSSKSSPFTQTISEVITKNIYLDG